MTEKSPIEFPCDFVIKVMGAANPHFETLALEIAARHCKKVYTDTISKKQSKEGNYISLTIPVYLENRAQMESLYQELRENPEVLMAL